MDESQFHVFDFASMSWLRPPLNSIAPPLGYHEGHMAVCHNDVFVVLGGKQLSVSLALKLCYLGHPILFFGCLSPLFVCHNGINGTATPQLCSTASAALQATVRLCCAYGCNLARPMQQFEGYWTA